MPPKQHGNTHAPIQGVEREMIILERVGAPIEVNAGSLEADLGDRFFLCDFPERLLRLVSLADREDGVTTHLASQGRRLTQHRVDALVQRHTIPQSMLAY